MPEMVQKVVQYGLETNNGEAVAADTRLVAEVALPESDRTVVVPAAGIGKRIPRILTAAYNQRIAAEGIRMTMPEGLYYQALPLLLSSLLKGNITPVEQTGGEGDYLWDFPLPLTGIETLDTFTLETADSVAANFCHEIPYCLLRDLEISGNADDGTVQPSATIDGAQSIPTTLTTVATLPTFTGVIGKLFQVYVDDTWAGLGGTELEEALHSFSLSVNGGGHHKRRGSASRVAGSHGQDQIIISLTLTLERTAAVIAESQKYYADTTTPRFVRLEIDSGIIIGAGENHTWTTDAAGVWRAWHRMGADQDGNNLDIATLEVGLDPTAVRGFNTSVITNVAAI